METSTSGRLSDLRRSERSMVPVRWVAVAFATIQVLTYERTAYPSGSYLPIGLALAGLLAVMNAGVMVALPRLTTEARAHRVGIAVLAADVLIAAGFVWLYSFDHPSALWAALVVLPLEGAVKFGLSGALATWVAVTALYAGGEAWASDRYAYPLEWNSVSFRMGVALLVALVAGIMSRDLTRERARLLATVTEQRRIDLLRTRLVSTMAHDVRNPLATIRGTLKMLVKHSDKLSAETARRLLETADQQSERLEHLATDLLELAKLESGNMDLAISEVPLREAVDRALTFADEERRMDVRIDPGLMVKADPRRLEQIVVNIASNAFRYGRPPFVLEATSDNGLVRMAFRDHGPGVAPEERATLFEPFRTEADATSVGFGLAIVKSLVEAHGGTVTYEPNDPKGACFLVVLPAALPGAQAEAGRSTA